MLWIGFLKHFRETMWVFLLIQYDWGTWTGNGILAILKEFKEVMVLVLRHLDKRVKFVQFVVDFKKAIMFFHGLKGENNWKINSQ